MRHVFIDESGFTGPDLLNLEQPYVAYAAVDIRPEHAERLVNASRARHRTQGSELKASTMLRRPGGRAEIADILREVSRRKLRVAVHDKRYALAAKFVEYTFEPVFRDVWIVLVNHGFQHFVAMLLYEAMNAREELAVDILTHFSDFMRGRDEIGLWTLLESHTPHHPFLADVAVVLRRYRSEIVAERALAHSAEDVPQFVLDLTSTSIYTVLHSLPDFTSVKYHVTLDDSRAMRLAAPRVEAFLPISEGRLSGEISLKSSQESAGIQIADLAAGATIYACHAREGYEIFTPFLVPDRLSDYNLIPQFIELQHVDHNRDVLNMIAENIRNGLDPVSRLKELLQLAVLAQGGWAQW